MKDDEPHNVRQFQVGDGRCLRRMVGGGGGRQGTAEKGGKRQGMVGGRGLQVTTGEMTGDDGGRRGMMEDDEGRRRRTMKVDGGGRWRTMEEEGGGRRATGEDDGGRRRKVKKNGGQWRTMEDNRGRRNAVRPGPSLLPVRQVQKMIRREDKKSSVLVLAQDGRTAPLRTLKISLSNTGIPITKQDRLGPSIAALAPLSKLACK